MKLGVISLGCDKATVDSERLVGELVGHGAVVTPNLPHELAHQPLGVDGRLVAAEGDDAEFHPR